MSQIVGIAAIGIGGILYKFVYQNNNNEEDIALKDISEWNVVTDGKKNIKKRNVVNKQQIAKNNLLFELTEKLKDRRKRIVGEYN